MSTDDHHVLLQHVSQQLMETNPTQNEPSSQSLPSSSSSTHSSHSPNSVSSNITPHCQPPQNKEPSSVQLTTESLLSLPISGPSTDPTNPHLMKQTVLLSLSQESSIPKDQDSRNDSPMESKIEEPPIVKEEKNSLCNELKRSIQDIEGYIESQQDARQVASIPPTESSQPRQQENDPQNPASSFSQSVQQDEPNTSVQSSQ